MIIKAKEISQHLGISQATVSLAINNKHGVSEQTKRRVLEYIEELKQNDKAKIVSKGKSIKVLSFVSERAKYEKEHADIKSVILMELSKNAQESGYNLILIYVNNEEEILDVIEQSVQDSTCGFLLLAADMKEENIRPFKDIDIPVVVCDYEYENIMFDCVYNDNYQAVRMAMNYLFELGHSDVLYLYNANIIYNFDKRRETFKAFIVENDLKESMIEVGTKIDVIYDFVVKYIKDGGRMPTAILAENYAISIATIKALQDCGYRINDDISIIGIDELPPYALTNFKFTHIKVLHESKSRLAITRLFEKVTKQPEEIVRIVVGNKFIEGNSVKKLN